jgi:predicted GIY-YIG superfamily endonuclease
VKSEKLKVEKVETARERKAPHGHHSVYVVYLRNPKRDGKAGYYVGMTGLSPEQRFENHKKGVKAARIVKKHGQRLVPKLYAHLNPMPYDKAKAMEVMLADSLRKRGYVVFGGH